MRAFRAYFKKELLENLRCARFLIIGILFAFFGILNPLLTYITPWMMDFLAESLAETGMEIGKVTVNAVTSWASFFENISMLLIAFALIYGGIFTKEYGSGTLILILTKGIARYKVVLAKALSMLISWTFGYLVCFIVTYLGNEIFWDNSEASGLFAATVYWWLFGVFVISLIVLASALARNFGIVLLYTGGGVLAFFLLGLFRFAAKYVPTALMKTTTLLLGMEKGVDYIFAAIITLVLSSAAIYGSILLFNKKQL